MRLILPHLWMWTHYTLLRNVVRPLSRVGTNIRPPGGGSNRGVAALRLTFPPAYGPRLGRSSTGGAAPPRPPRAAPPVRPSAHGPLPLVAQRGGPGRGGLSPLSAAIGGNTRRARIAREIPLPLGFLKNGCLASEARQAEGGTPVVKVAPQWVHVVKLGVLRACPHVPT